MKFFNTLLISIVLLVPISAQAITLDFDDAVIAGVELNPYISGGFTVQASTLLTATSTAFAVNSGRSSTFNNGLNYLSISGSLVDRPKIEIKNIGGSLFNLNSLQLGSTKDSSVVNAQITAVNNLGDVLSMFVNNLTALSNISLSGFTNLSSVLIIGSVTSITSPTELVGLSIDNLDVTTVSTVPAPAAVWLFGSALLGFLGFSRRKLK